MYGCSIASSKLGTDADFMLLPQFVGTTIEIAWNTYQPFATTWILMKECKPKSRVYIHQQYRWLMQSNFRVFDQRKHVKFVLRHRFTSLAWFQSIEKRIRPMIHLCRAYHDSNHGYTKGHYRHFWSIQVQIRSRWLLQTPCCCLSQLDWKGRHFRTRSW